MDHEDIRAEAQPDEETPTPDEGEGTPVETPEETPAETPAEDGGTTETTEEPGE